MTESVRSYLLSLVAIGFIDVILQAILPNGVGKRTATAACGLLMVFIVINPIANLDLEELSRSIAKMDVTETASASGVTIDNQAIIAGIIKENTETYIWDKAVELGMQPVKISAEVVCDGGYPYPSQVAFYGTYSEKSRLQLSAWIENELAIESKHQEWVWNKGNG